MLLCQVFPTKVCRCQGLSYCVLVLKLLCSRYIVLHVWLTCQGVHKYIDHNPDFIVWKTFWRSISFSECSKKNLVMILSAKRLYHPISTRIKLLPQKVFSFLLKDKFSCQKVQGIYIFSKKLNFFFLRFKFWFFSAMQLRVTSTVVTFQPVQLTQASFLEKNQMLQNVFWYL